MSVKAIYVIVDETIAAEMVVYLNKKYKVIVSDEMIGITPRTEADRPTYVYERENNAD